MAAGYVISDVWLRRLCENAVQGAVSWPTNEWELMLFVNDHTVTDADQDLSGFEEASWGGYGRQGLDPSMWVAVPVASHIAQERADADLNFLNVGGPTETVFGYCIVDGTGGLVLAESFTAGTDVADGGTFTIRPSLRYKTCR